MARGRKLPTCSSRKVLLEGFTLFKRGTTQEPGWGLRAAPLAEWQSGGLALWPVP